MQINIDNKLIEKIIEWNVIQNSWTISSTDLRSAQVARIEYQVSQIVMAVVQQEIKKYRIWHSKK